MNQTERPGADVAVALLHHPVYDKNRQVVTTAVTNLDLHDIARAAKTFGLVRYYVVTPVVEQKTLASRITRHWQEGWGAGYNPKRKAALDLVTVLDSLDEAVEDLSRLTGREVVVVATGARTGLPVTTCQELAARMDSPDRSYLLVLGTGWGLTEKVLERADMVLEPIQGAGEYNHLSVRSAAAIFFDRLFGRR